MLLLVLFAFISGLTTILAPCIWPLLPLVLSTTASHPSRRRPLGIAIGIPVSFGVFTLLISELVRLFHLDPNWFRWFSVVILCFFGLSLLMPGLNAWVGGQIKRLIHRLSLPDQTWDDGFSGGLLTGISLGIVWSPAAGPILATLTAMVASGEVDGWVLPVAGAYILGVGLPLFGLAYGGQRLVHTRGTWFDRHGRLIQLFFGITTIVSAVFIAINVDKMAEAALLKMFPQYTNAQTHFENTPAVQKRLKELKQ